MSLSSNALDMYSESRENTLPTDLGPANRAWDDHQYSIFSTKSSRPLYLGVLKNLTECTVAYFISNNMTINPAVGTITVRN